jgi:membrane protease YdiL (CAAX protease family)
MTEPNKNEPPLVLRPEQDPQVAPSPEPDAKKNEPPLVLRPGQESPAPGAPTQPAPRKPGPGLLGAVGWCIVFVAAQIFGALLTVCIVFAAHVFAAPNPQQFFDEQMDGFNKAVGAQAPGNSPAAPGTEADPKAPRDRPAMPTEFGHALAWGMLAAQFVSLGMIVVVFPRRIGRDWKRQLGVRTPHWMHVVLVLLIVPGFMVCADAIQTLFLWATGLKPPAAVRALNGVFGTFPWPLTALAVAIGPGLVEELWCRGFIGRGLSARYGLVLGVLLTAVLFAAMHGDPSQLLVITVMGVYLHFVYLASRSIWVPILLHASNNGLAILLALTVKPSENEAQVTPIIVYIAALALMIFGSVALWTSRAELKPVPGDDPTWWDEPESAVAWQPEYPGISTPPPEADAQIGYVDVSPVALLFTVGSFGALLYLGHRFLI